MSHAVIDFQMRELHQSSSRVPNESINKNLWRLTLEEHGLYNALKEYQVQKSAEGNLPHQILVEHSVDKGKKPQVNSGDTHQQLVKTTDNPEGMSGAAKHNVIDLQVTSSNLKPSQVLQVGGLSYNQVYVENFNHIAMNVDTTLYGGLVMRDKIKWLDKNALLTVVNSNLELWLRDSSIADHEVGMALKRIKHSMADLGVSLAQVVINGKVVFRRN